MVKRKLLFVTARMGVAAAALGAVGLTACDPAPPLTCEDIAPEALKAQAAWDGSIVEVRLDACGPYECARWSDVSVHDLVGAELEKIQVLDKGVIIRLRMNGDAGSDAGGSSPAGSFSVRANTYPPEPTNNTDSCKTLDKTLEFRIENGKAVVYDKLATSRFGDGPGVRIAVVGQNGCSVELRPVSQRQGATEWTVSGGVLESSTEGNMRWTLPDEPGLYMAELVVTGGSQGFGRDVLLVEVV
ncbi:MAG: hypothetical protein HY898_10710 [Deltaproteobacteria bacterium]|nr:hypothetical protein [Deltaproteobacteria bacterium]